MPHETAGCSPNDVPCAIGTSGTRAKHCPGCLRSELEWVELSGNGTIYTFNVMRKPGNPMMADAVPYVLALVDLDEGVRMTTNIVHVSPEEVRCGQRVSVDWSIQLDDGRCLPTFAPTVR